MLHDWQCPNCGLRFEIEENRTEEAVASLLAPNAVGPRGFRLRFLVCPNQECAQPHVTLAMYELQKDDTGNLFAGKEATRSWCLMPEGGGKRLPGYVPEEVVQEHRQAVELKEISPSAACTMARRCLHAMINDFWQVKKSSVSDEFDAIKDKLDPDTWEAIENVRSSGRIGRQLGMGVNLVVDAQQDDVDLLIGLIEYLVEEWYGARHQRQERLAKIKQLGGSSPGGD